MSEKTVITCDAMSCSNEYEHFGGDFIINDISQRGWIYIPDYETHYCPACKKEVIQELKSDDIEYIE